MIGIVNQIGSAPSDSAKKENVPLSKWSLHGRKRHLPPKSSRTGQETRASVSAAPGNDGGDCQKQDAQVQPDGLVLNVMEVEVNAVFKGQAGAA